MQGFKITVLLRRKNSYLGLNLCTVASFFVIAIIGSLIVFQSGPKLLYDEVFFVPNLSLFSKLGFTQEFLLNMQGQHPGPLYQITHWLFKPLTAYQIVPVRLVNLSLACVFIWQLRQTIKQTYDSNAAYAASFAIAVPSFWVVSAVALSEIPAMLVLVLSYRLLISVIKPTLDEGSRVSRNGLIQAAFSGFLLGLSIIGRTQFLVIIPAVLMFGLYSRRLLVPLIIFIAFSVILPAYVFLSWKGLVPPHGQHSQSGVNFTHGITAFAYASFTALLICPNWFQRENRVLLFCSTLSLLLVAINLVVVKYEFLPINSSLRPFLSPMQLKTAARLFPVLFIFIAVWFSVSIVINTYNNRIDPFYTFSAICVCSILLTCVKSTFQFSSRYPLLALPFIIILTAESIKPNLVSFARLLLGATIGYALLTNYYV